MMQRFVVAGGALALALLVARPALSQSAQPETPGATPPAAPPDKAALDEAKNLFHEGVALFEAGEIEGALAKFNRSRATFASSINTINAALCLDKLQRSDEALELYELTIAKYSADLEAQDKKDVTAAMTALRKKVGTLEVSANVEGNLVVDGRPRGKLPLTRPLRVIPGRHVLRIIKDGYSTYETTFSVAPTEVKKVDGHLEALQASGGLRIEDPSNPPGAQIVIDGAVLGPNPWEGSVAPGVHVVQALSATLGSRPAQAIVVKGQTTLVRLKSAPLGPAVFVTVSPSTAELSLDGAPVGHGQWQGAVPAGDYVIRASEDGYFAQEKRVQISQAAAGTKAQRLVVTLNVDQNSPRWPKRPSGHFWVRAVGNALFGSSLHSGPESNCGSTCSGLAAGFLAGLGIGYELPFGLSFEVRGGYLSVARSLNRDLTQSFPKNAPTSQTTYALKDLVRVRGPMIGGGMSYRIKFTPKFSFVGGATVGALIATGTDTVTGTATTGTDSADVSIPGAQDSVSSASVFVMPELGVTYAIGSWYVGASAAILIVPQRGPDLPRSQIVVAPDGCDATHPAAVGCTPVSTALSSESSHGPFTLFSPQLSFGHTF